jgi:hypothetical protein
VGQIGSVYKQPEKREDDSCHSWRAPSKWKGGTKGSRKGNSKGSKGKVKRRQEQPRHVYVNVTCVQRIIKCRIMLSRVHTIMTRMNVVLYIIII